MNELESRSLENKKIERDKNELFALIQSLSSKYKSESGVKVVKLFLDN